MMTMRHKHDNRIDELYGFLECHRDLTTRLIPHSKVLKKFKDERLQLIQERWEDLLARYGHPLNAGWPNVPIRRRGLPVAADGIATLLELNAAG